MTAERINVQLTPFEKVAILREQQNERKKELKELESTLKELQRKIATHRYLESLSPYYTMTAEGVPQQDEIDKLEERRRLILELIDTIEKELPAMLETAQSGTPQPAPGNTPPSPPQAGASPAAQDAPVKKAKFDF